MLWQRFLLICECFIEFDLLLAFSVFRQEQGNTGVLNGLEMYLPNKGSLLIISGYRRVHQHLPKPWRLYHCEVWFCSTVVAVFVYDLLMHPNI